MWLAWGRKEMVGSRMILRFWTWVEGVMMEPSMLRVKVWAERVRCFGPIMSISDLLQLSLRKFCCIHDFISARQVVRVEWEDGKDQQWSCLLSCWSWSGTGLGEPAGRSRWPSRLTEWSAASIAFVLGSGGSIPDGDWWGEERLNDGCVELDHHFLRHVEFLPQEEHPLLGLHDGGGDVLRPPQVMCNYTPQESERLHCVNWRVTHGEGDSLSWAPPEVCYHLYSFLGHPLQVVLAPPGSQAVNFLSVGGLVSIGD